MKLRRLGLAAVAFLLVCLFGAALAWMAGFDFNRRGLDVAETASYILIFAIGAAVMIMVCGDEP